MVDSANIYWAAAAAFAASTPVALVAGRIDKRRLAGEDVWNKPAKFGIALALHFATFALVQGYLGHGIILLTDAWLSVGAAVIEVTWIAVQAGRQRRSHFNKETRLEAVVYVAMGLAGLLVLSPAVVIGVAAARSPPLAWPPAVQLAVPVAFIVGTGLTLLVTLWMGRLNSHYAAPPPSRRRAMWLTGWTLNAADLRPAHFLGTHVMQAVPAIALAGSWLLQPTVALVIAGVAATGWTGLTLALLWRTVAGRALPGYFTILA